MKQLALRYPGTCRGCGAPLEAGTRAWWDASAKQINCFACLPGGPLPVDPPVDPVASEVWIGDRGTPGASARAERQRRSAKREDRVRTNHPRVGGFLLAVSDDPRSTRVWDRGAVGEEKVGAHLERARVKGIEVLHDRRIRGSRANIDHLVIAPTGVWVVDAKRYLDKKIERRDVGGLFKTDLRLFVGGRDQTKLVTAVHKQTAPVVEALRTAGHHQVPVRGVLCFVDVKTVWLAKPFRVDGVLVTWRKHLVTPMLAASPGVAAAGRLDDAQRGEIARLLADRFPPS